MAFGNRMRRDIRLANKHMRREANRWGQEVDWYCFDFTSIEDVDSNDDGIIDDDLYDEGGAQERSWKPGVVGTAGRKWFVPRKVQVQMARIDEGAEVYDETGSYDVDRITLVVNRALLASRGIDVEGDRLNDRIGFDGRIFNVDHFEKRGRIGDTYLTHTVTGSEVKDDEQHTDVVPWHA